MKILSTFRPINFWINNIAVDNIYTSLNNVLAFKQISYISTLMIVIEYVLLLRSGDDTIM